MIKDLHKLSALNPVLFLDRDGVINKRLVDDYVKTWEEFEFLPGVLDSLKILSNRFKYVFLITNQQGVGKKLMSDNDLKYIHEKMLSVILKNGGKVDNIYYCPHLAGFGCNCRKPGIGLVLKAQEEYGIADLSKSVMVGDSISDMLFGRNVGAKNVYITNNNQASIVEGQQSFVDYVFFSLIDFARAL